MTAVLELEAWGDELARHCAAKLTRSISATDLVMDRSWFGQTVRPAKGSVLASPAASFAEGEPDYFFHWVRDSSTVMEAVRILAGAEPAPNAWTARFNDFVQFSLDLGKIDGKRFVEIVDFRTRTPAAFKQYLRSNTDIAEIRGERVAGDVRYNADGTPDFILWNRPQHDGPALRALVAMRFEEDGLAVDGEAKQRLAELIGSDLRYTAEYAGCPGYDIWEEEKTQHYGTVLVQFAALEKGAARAERAGAGDLASLWREKAAAFTRIAR